MKTRAGAGVLQFSANIGFLWKERPLIERIHAAKRAGFAAVEFHWPYDVPVTLIADALRATALATLSINAPAGDRSIGELGFAGLKGGQQAFENAFEHALAYAEIIDSAAIHVLAGIGTLDEGVIVERLCKAAQRGKGRMILIEPMNHITVSGYALADFAQAARIVLVCRSSGARVGLMLDCFHATLLGADPIALFEQHRGIIGHIQFSDAPERSAPTEGSAAFAFLQHLEKAGWSMPVGAEFLADDTDQSLEFMAAFKARA
jgi:2-dehydrotetronate isomerase